MAGEDAAVVGLDESAEREALEAEQKAVVHLWQQSHVTQQGSATIGAVEVPVGLRLNGLMGES